MSEFTNSSLPEFSSDPVVDFCVREAIAVRAGAEREAAAKKQERRAWQKADTKHLENVA